MPTYEYRCVKCGHQFEHFQFINDEPLGRGDCPVCHGEVKRLISGGAGFLFKGSGFYLTDYRSEGYRKAASAETSAPTNTDSVKPEKAS